ncbi:pterin-4-alpha-carbinolamine dehydratase 2, mitochondrial [Selaginella moellendorffii]|uniref:pterin-4-alpha-carbinolamine dehydratase 2, mitochondrial n=1 Tax=Selaginella moellendorffii TaxID=88036 RepID=UPI000D1C4413|nr:pterin-4-alpha-carbinolamine dehydratase 2, mitochondrial [Selaginella moellendorffii]|eukprot:XP_024517140.1 pterin-4-alpha-carbinolamine dehydratase 2, mitochondrial [Selaginella moellendorffii]
MLGRMAYSLGVFGAAVACKARIPIAVIARSMSSQSSQASDEIISDLSKKKCVPCDSKNLRPMSEESAKELLHQAPGWTIEQVDGKLELQRSWRTKSFIKGIEFFKLVSDVAEAEGHHPDLHLTGYNNVRINISTHSAGGLTENDFILAAKIGALDASDLFRKPKV